MNAVVRRKLEMAARVLEFSQAHPSNDPSHASVLAKLEERIVRADALITQQRAGLIAAHAATARRGRWHRWRELRLGRRPPRSFKQHVGIQVRPGGQVHRSVRPIGKG